MQGVFNSVHFNIIPLLTILAPEYFKPHAYMCVYVHVCVYIYVFQYKLHVLIISQYNI